MTTTTALGEHPIPAGAHWTTEGPHGEDWVIRWNSATGTVQARRWQHGEPGSFSAEAADLPAARREVLQIAGMIADDESGEFIPGSVTDTCGVCFKPFDLQRRADQHKTVHNWGTDTWDLICDDCDDAIPAEA